MPEELQHLTPMVPLSFTYNYRVGEYMEKYLQGLAEKKILGVRCPGCKRVLLPPRSACGACNATPDEWIEIDPVGTLENFTVGHVTVGKSEITDLTEPVIVGQIRLDGADSLLTAHVRGVDPMSLKRGMRLRAVWRDETKGDVHDLDCFEPATDK